MVYNELHHIASQRLRKERPGHTLRPTALVNEAYLRMVAPPGGSPFTDRAHFMAFASSIMRNILVDYARQHSARKRGGQDPRTPLDADLNLAVEGVADVVQLLDLDLAIEALASEYPQHAQTIEMRYFGGMTAEETAESVGRSVHIVQHELRFAHAWLRRKLGHTR